jgi:hypothetical protein
MVLLITSDHEQFVVDKEVAERSVVIKNMLEGPCTVVRCGVIAALKRVLPLCRSRRERPADPVTRCVLERAEEGRYYDY